VEAIATQSLIVEITTGQNRTRERIAMAEGQRGFTIGRSVSADVTLDDEYVAALHARIEVMADGRLVVSDLGSVNGIVVGGTKHQRADGVALQDGRLQVGRTRLHIRVPHEILAPEKPEVNGGGSRRYASVWLAGVGASAILAQMAYGTWLVAPTDPAAVFASKAAATVMLVVAWTGIWALLTRIMLGQWRWMEHMGILLAVVAAVTVASDMVTVAWFSLSLPMVRTSLTFIPLALVVSVLLYLHVRYASTISVWRAVLAVGATVAVILIAGIWYVERDSVRDVSSVTGLPNRMFPERMRLTSAKPLDELLQGASALRAVADRKREALPPGEQADDDE
jgi:pSer/pThr/pTyr-binding forkhead associated (FHA) protein